MKTIEQASKEYSSKVNGSCYNDLYPDSDQTRGEVTEKEFKAGVEFAQQWIDIKEEIPLIGEWVTCKKNYSYHTMRIRSKSDLKIIKINFTHWRPVERK